MASRQSQPYRPQLLTQVISRTVLPGEMGHVKKAIFPKKLVTKTRRMMLRKMSFSHSFNGRRTILATLMKSHQSLGSFERITLAAKLLRTQRSLPRLQPIISRSSLTPSMSCMSINFFLYLATRTKREESGSSELLLRSCTF